MWYHLLVLTAWTHQVYSAATGIKTVQAHGKPANLGTGYNRATDTFLPASPFITIPVSAKQTIRNPSVDSSFHLIRDKEDSMSALGLDLEAKVAVWAKLVELNGGMSYLQEESFEGDDTHVVLTYKSRTCYESINIKQSTFNGSVDFSGMQQLGVDDVVLGVQWGSFLVVSFGLRETNVTDKMDIRAELDASLEKLRIPAGLKGELNVTSNETRSFEDLQIQIHGDILPEKVVFTSMDGVASFLDSVPSLLQKINDGKGNPLAYTLISLPALRAVLNQEESSLPDHNSPGSETGSTGLDPLYRQIQEEYREMNKVTRKFKAETKRLHDYKDYLPHDTLQKIRDFEFGMDNNVETFNAAMGTILRTTKQNQSIDVTVAYQKSSALQRNGTYGRNETVNFLKKTIMPLLKTVEELELFQSKGVRFVERHNSVANIVIHEGPARFLLVVPEDWNHQSLFRFMTIFKYFSILSGNKFVVRCDIPELKESSCMYIHNQTWITTTTYLEIAGLAPDEWVYSPFRPDIVEPKVQWSNFFGTAGPTIPGTQQIPETCS